MWETKIEFFVQHKKGAQKNSFSCVEIKDTVFYFVYEF